MERGQCTHIAARHWECRWEEKENGGYNHVYDAELLLDGQSEENRAAQWKD